MKAIVNDEKMVSIQRPGKAIGGDWMRDCSRTLEQKPDVQLTTSHQAGIFGSGTSADPVPDRCSRLNPSRQLVLKSAARRRSVVSYVIRWTQPQMRCGLSRWRTLHW